jgi:hypothetical protein
MPFLSERSPVKAETRKAIAKEAGDKVTVHLKERVGR